MTNFHPTTLYLLSAKSAPASVVQDVLDRLESGVHVSETEIRQWLAQARKESKRPGAVTDAVRTADTDNGNHLAEDLKQRAAADAAIHMLRQHLANAEYRCFIDLHDTAGPAFALALRDGVRAAEGGIAAKVEAETTLAPASPPTPRNVAAEASVKSREVAAATVGSTASEGSRKVTATEEAEGSQHGLPKTINPSSHLDSDGRLIPEAPGQPERASPGASNSSAKTINGDEPSELARERLANADAPCAEFEEQERHPAGLPDRLAITAPSDVVGTAEAERATAHKDWYQSTPPSWVNCRKPSGTCGYSDCGRSGRCLAPPTHEKAAA